MRLYFSFFLTLSCLSAIHLQTRPLKGPQDQYTVYVFLHEACIISQYYTLPLRELHEEYANDSIEFVGLFPNLSSKPRDIQAFQDTYDIPFELKHDYFHLKKEALGVTVTPEVVVYNETKGRITYRGRIDDAYVRIGQRKRVITTSELKDVLEAITDNQPIEVVETQAVGCFIEQVKLE